MVRREEMDDGNALIVITCDKCGREAPPATEILAGHGLNNMGWRCRGGSHLCPEHAEQR